MLCLQPIKYAFVNSQILWPTRLSLTQFWESFAPFVIREQVSGILEELEEQLVKVSTEIQQHVDQVEAAIEEMRAYVDNNANMAQINEDFVR